MCLKEMVLFFMCTVHFRLTLLVVFNPIALKKAKIAYNFCLSECNRVKHIDGDAS